MARSAERALYTTYNGYDRAAVSATTSTGCQHAPAPRAPLVAVSSADELSDIVQDCSCVVACHPDEATGAVVEWCVRHRKPFAVVPCCVFARLFPGRRNVDGSVVTTTAQLCDWIQRQHPSIQRATLDFDGASTVLYSGFDLEAEKRCRRRSRVAAAAFALAATALVATTACITEDK